MEGFWQGRLLLSIAVDSNNSCRKMEFAGPLDPIDIAIEVTLEMPQRCVFYLSSSHKCKSLSPIAYSAATRKDISCSESAARLTPHLEQDAKPVQDY